MFMQKIIFIPVALLASGFFTYILFRRLRHLNYKEERVFDLIFANLAFLWLMVVTGAFWLLPLVLIFSGWFILNQKSWHLFLALSGIVQAFLVFTAVILLGGFFIFGLPVFVIPVSVALLISFMILSTGNETIENICQKVAFKINQRRKRAYKKS
ncbi:MAG: hypothetical protein ABH814_03890 [bacterium]